MADNDDANEAKVRAWARDEGRRARGEPLWPWSRTIWAAIMACCAVSLALVSAHLVLEVVRWQHPEQLRLDAQLQKCQETVESASQARNDLAGEMADLKKISRQPKELLCREACGGCMETYTEDKCVCRAYCPEVDRKAWLDADAPPAYMRCGPTDSGWSRVERPTVIDGGVHCKVMEIR